MEEESLFDKLKRKVKEFGVSFENELVNQPKPPQSLADVPRYMYENVEWFTRPERGAVKGFIEGLSGGLIDLPDAPTPSGQVGQNVGRVAGFLLGGKLIGKIPAVSKASSSLIKKGLNIASKGGISKHIGTGLVNLAEGVPYGIMASVPTMIKSGGKEGVKSFAESSATDLALGSVPVVGGLLVSTKVGKTIKNEDELASVVFKEYGGKIGDEVKLPSFEELAKDLANKGYSFSKNLVDKITKLVPEKYLTGKGSLIYKEGNNLFVGFDEDFKPIKNLSKEKPTQTKVKQSTTQSQVDLKTKLQEEVKPFGLLEGEVKPLTPKQAEFVFKKTGEAPEFVNVLKQGGESIPLAQTVEETSRLWAKGKSGLISEDIISADKDLNAFNDFFAQSRRVFEDLGTKAKEYTVDFLTKQLAQGRNLQKQIVEKLKPIFDEAGVKPDNANDEALFDFIDNKISQEEIAKQFPDKVDAFITAKEEVRKVYDDLLQRINEVRVRFGYEPIKRREDYITHLVEMGDSVARLLGRDFGASFFDIKSAPRVPFFRFGIERKGSTQYKRSVLEAIDKYLSAAANQIYLPEAIDRFKLVSQLAEQKGLPVYAKYSKDIANYLAKGIGEMTQAVKNTPLLRFYEDTIGSIASRVSLNLVSRNISAAISNITQTVTVLPTQVSLKSFFVGGLSALLDPLTEEKNFMVDGIQSTFLRLRNKPPKLYEKTIDKIIKKGDVFSWFSNLADQVAFRAYLNDAWEKGLPLEEAIKEADNRASMLVGERVFGLVPKFIRDPALLRPLTMFTLEPVNALYSIFRDNFKMSEGKALEFASRLGAYMVLAEIWNNITEKAIGRKFAFSPIGFVVEATDIMNQPYSDTEKRERLANALVRQIPLSDIFLGKGRWGAPIFAPIPTQQELGEDPAMALTKTILLLQPLGGGYQIYKTIEGLRAYARGSVQTPKGEIKYPIKKTPTNLVKLALFGKSSVPEAREYYELGRKPLTLRQSRIFEAAGGGEKLYESMMFQRAISSEIQSFKRDVNEELLKGNKNIDKFIKDRLEETKKNIKFHIKYYKQPKDMYGRVMDLVVREVQAAETPNNFSDVLQAPPAPQTSVPVGVSVGNKVSMKVPKPQKPTLKSVKLPSPKLELEKKKVKPIRFKRRPAPKIKIR
jgi:hypothetical protein